MRVQPGPGYYQNPRIWLARIFQICLSFYKNWFFIGTKRQKVQYLSKYCLFLKNSFCLWQGNLCRISLSLYLWKNVIFWSWMNLEAPKKQSYKFGHKHDRFQGPWSLSSLKIHSINPKWSFLNFLSLSKRLFEKLFESKRAKSNALKRGTPIAQENL